MYGWRMPPSVHGLMAFARLALRRATTGTGRLALAGGAVALTPHVLYTVGSGSGTGSNGRLNIDLESRSPGEAALRLTGELDMVTSPLLRDELTRHRGRGRRVVLDLSGIEFIDSTGLVLLMEAAREPSHDGWALALRRNVSPVVARLFEVTRTESLFDWVDEA